MSNNKNRPDQDGSHRAQFDKNKKKILATQNTCGICGRLVEVGRYKYPHPLAATVDHIIPVNKGGHPSDIENLQLAHWTCNRQKSDKIFRSGKEEPRQSQEEVVTNRNLPHSRDWMRFKK